MFSRAKHNHWRGTANCEACRDAILRSAKPTPSPNIENRQDASVIQISEPTATNQYETVYNAYSVITEKPPDVTVTKTETKEEKLKQNLKKYGERDYLNTSPIPADSTIVWRVECPCCGLGPAILWGIARKEHSKTVARGTQSILSDMQKHIEEVPAWKNIPEIQNSNWEPMERMACFTDPRDAPAWFSSPTILAQCGFQWAAYAVPKGMLIETENQAVFHREESRRIGYLPVVEKLDEDAELRDSVELCQQGTYHDERTSEQQSAGRRLAVALRDEPLRIPDKECLNKLTR